MSTTTSEAVKKTPPPPKLVTTNKAFKLAEQWVNNMSKSLEDESIEEELEGRPSRLGLGAKVPRQSKVGFSNDPVERKLQAKLTKKRKDASSTEETLQSAGDGYNNDEDEDEESESRTSAFAKRKMVPLILPLQKQGRNSSNLFMFR